MDEPSDVFLTEDRIRAVVRNAAGFYKRARSGKMEPGDGDLLADSNRLQHLLNVLEKGTVEDAIAAHRRRFERFGLSRFDHDAARGVRANQEIYEAELRAIPQSEVDAVLACLDEIATVYKGPAEAVRARHDTAHRSKLMEAAKSTRIDDPSRPQLTPERIRRLLDVLDAIVP